MRRLLALLLTLSVASLVVSWAPEGGQLARPTALALGVALIAAALAGELFERIRLPRLSGYLVFGLVCGPYLANIITRPMARDLQFVNGLAISLIALIAGLELNYNRIKPRLAVMLKLGTGTPRFALALLFTTIVVSFSPTVTIAVIADTRSRGPITEMVLALVVLADLFLIVLFTLSMQLVRWTSGTDLPGDVSLLARISWEIFGSLAFGAAFGAIFAFYLRKVGRELTIALLALCVALSELGPLFHFEPLLASLAAGLVVENIAPPSGDSLRDAVERGALPVLIVFFAAAGASLQLDALALIGLVAAAVSAIRLVTIRAGVDLAARVARVPGETADLVWMGLVSQAGVTLGLVILVVSEFQDWGVRLQSLMVAMIAIHELIGPVLFRAALARAGEIGKMDAGVTEREFDAEPLHAD